MLAKTDELTLRDKVCVVREASVSVRYMELLLQLTAMTPRDRAYVERVYDIVKPEGDDDDLNRRNDAGAPVPR